jgi:probable F420-dependent oxidoreductase
MEAWLGLSFQATSDMVADAVAAEDAGYAGVVVSDHLVWPGRITSPYPYSADGSVRWPPDTEWPDAWVLAGAVLQATSTLRFATNVYLPLLRHPAVVAKAVSTAASLSGDRVALGVGAGWMSEEFMAMDKEFAGRGAVLDKALAMLGELWSGQPVRQTKGQRAVDGVVMLPPPQRPIPIWVGGHSRAAVRRAVRHDGWIAVLGRDVDKTADEAAQVRGLRSESPTGDGGFAVMVTGYTDDLDKFRRLADAGVDGIFLTPGRFAPQDGPDRHTAIRRYADRVVSRLP